MIVIFASFLKIVSHLNSFFLPEMSDCYKELPMNRRYTQMLFLIAFLGLQLPAVIGSAQAEPQTINLVQDSNYPPYMHLDENGPAGIYADIIREASQRLDGYEINLKAATWTRAIYQVENGKAHALVGTYFRPVRRPWIRHFSTPLATEAVYVYCRKGVAQPDWAYPRDFTGLLFSNNSGFATPGAAFFETVDAGEIDLVEEEIAQENLRLLQIGRADCYVQEQAAVESVLKAEGYDAIDRVRIVQNETAHLGYSRQWPKQDAETFIRHMDAVLKDMHTDGTISSIINNHMSNSNAPAKTSDLEKGACQTAKPC